MFYRVIRKLLPAGAEYSSVIVYAIDPASVAAVVSATSTDIAYRKVGAVDSDLQGLLSDAYDPVLLQQRLQNDSQLVYVAISQGTLAAYAWVTTSPCFISEIRFSFTMTGGCCYIYDCYVAPSFRGQGVYQNLLRKILTDFAGQKPSNNICRLVYIASEPGNTASIRGIRRVGFRRTGQARYVSVGKWSKLFGVSDLSIPAKTPCDNPRDGL